MDVDLDGRSTGCRCWCVRLANIREHSVDANGSCAHHPIVTFSNHFEGSCPAGGSGRHRRANASASAIGRAGTCGCGSDRNTRGARGSGEGGIGTWGAIRCTIARGATCACSKRDERVCIGGDASRIADRRRAGCGKTGAKEAAPSTCGKAP